MEPCEQGTCSPTLGREQALSLLSGSIDSKTLDYQRTNPREYQAVRTHTEPLGYKTRHHPTSSSTLCRMSHLNNKQAKIQTQSLAGRITTSLSLTHQRKNNNNKTHTNLTLYEAYINHRTNLRRAEAKRKKEFKLESLEKDSSNTIS